MENGMQMVLVVSGVLDIFLPLLILLDIVDYVKLI
jgi:hypothetical protein